jgi:hypothetical protein
MVRSFSSKPRSARKEAGREKASRKRESIFDISKTGLQSGPLFCWDIKKTIHRCYNGVWFALFYQTTCFYS